MRLITIALALCVLVAPNVASPQGPEDCPLNELRPNPEDPTSFFSCAPEGPIEMQCPKGLVFDADTNQCEWPQENSEASEEIITDPSDNSGVPVEEGEDSSGEAELETDAPPVEPEISGEEVIEDTEAPPEEDSEIPSDEAGDETDPETEAPGVECREGSMYMPDPASCIHFYQCSHGTPYRFACPARLVFNPEISVCDWPFNYKCV